MSMSNYGAGIVNSIPTPGTPTHPVTVLLEKFQISQMLYGIQRSYNYDISALIDALYAFQNTGEKPVMISMRNGSGHSVLGYKITQDASGYTVSLYDNNYPNQTRTLTIGNDKKIWQNTDYASYNSASGGVLRFLFSDAVGENMTKHLGNEGLYLSVSTSDVTIYNSGGIPADEIEGALQERVFDNQVHNDVAYYLPTDTYSIVPGTEVLSAMAEGDAEPFTIGISDGETYISVSNPVAFQSTFTLGDSPRFDVEDVSGEFSVSVTTTLDGFSPGRVNVYQYDTHSFTISLFGELNGPGTGDAIDYDAGDMTTGADNSKSFGFTFDAGEAPERYTILATAGQGGSVAGAGKYNAGKQVTLIATPDAGYRFDAWYEDGAVVAGAGATYSFAAETDRTLEARFVGLGDVNSSGRIDLQDVLLIYQHFRNKTTLVGDAYQAADVNGDGLVNMVDVLLAYRYFRGKITTLAS